MRATQEVVKRLIKECVEEAVGYVVSAMTEPAVAALEGMGPGGGLKNLHIEHAEHTHASTQLNTVSVSIHGRTAGKLTKAKTAHGRTRGRDSIADAIDPIADKAMEALTKAAKTMGDHVGQTLPKVVKQISVDHKNTDDDLRDRFARQRKGDHDNDSGGGKDGAGKGPTPDRKQPDSPLGAKDEPRRNGIPLEVPKPDIPEIQVYPRHEGRIWVRGPLGVGTLGEVDTLEEAFALVVGSLPEDCGPAVLGDANEVRRRQDG